MSGDLSVYKAGRLVGQAKRHLRHSSVRDLRGVVRGAVQVFGVAEARFRSIYPSGAGRRAVALAAPGVSP